MIPFVRDIRFDYGKPDQVSPLIRRVVANNPGPFTFLGTGTYIVGQGEVAVIDPGPDMDDHLEALLAATAGETITTILTTHTHSDHSPLARPLAERTGATIYGRAAPGAGEATLKIEEDHDGLFRPDVELADGQTVSGPGWSLEAVFTPGHISNHVCFALPQENALFSGDHIMGWSTTVISQPDGDMTDYYASLDKVAARSFGILWPTHGPPITDVAPFIAAYKAHRLDRERQILEQIAAGHRHIRDMVPVMYAAVDPKLHPAAAGSVYSHLLHLARQGAVVTDGTPTMASEFRLGEGAG